MARREIIVIGGSAGALDPLKTLIAGLPSDFPAAVFPGRRVRIAGL